MSTVGIIGAMEVEVETLKKHMKVRRTVKKAHMEFCEGVLGRKRGCCGKKRHWKS